MSAELRNTIYELAFTADHNEGEKVRLFGAKPPAKSLLLSCRQTYIEAKGYYVEAYQKYWRTTEFVMSTSELKRKSIELSDVKGEDVDKVTELGIWEERADSAYMRFRYVLDHGVWTMGDGKTPPIDWPQEFKNGFLIFGAVQDNPHTIRASLAFRLQRAQGLTVPLRLLLALLVWYIEEDRSNNIHEKATPIDWLPQWK
ncbi:hypothetical protein HII31_10563 [Pseudocercospora fuligena]|uniref:Uncharacterized protein n=1 Tax=Pseudocercospora fuligena TaxID=685502 RepID=A0A8H6RBV3_9PEZI|nr:hypothetical protein HII31_10563 [Pseudocercospora fuligena]